MSLVDVFRSLPTIVRRYESTFDRARPFEPAFAPHPTAAALLAAISFDSPLPLGERQELVRALVILHRSTHHFLWSALLLHTFRPMLLSLRARDRGEKEDRDARILLAFLQALARTPLAGQPVFIALRRATERVVFQAVRAERVHAETVSLDTAATPSVQLHGEPAPFVGRQAYEMATRLLASTDGDNRDVRRPSRRHQHEIHPATHGACDSRGRAESRPGRVLVERGLFPGGRSREPPTEFCHLRQRLG
jgi:hypothetical protein